MKRIALLTVIATQMFLMSAVAQSFSPAFFDSTDAFLKEHVEGGVVNYAMIQQDMPALNELVSTISQADVSGESAATRQAFYINAYNILVIKGAMNAYPVASVQDIPDFFDNKAYQVSGEKVSLNQLEKEMLFPEFGDARFHFVLVCGALGCPPLTDFVYRPETLDQQLEEQTRIALNDPYFIRVNDADGRVELSQIFNWYASDFGGSKAAVLEYINAYRTTKIPSSYRQSFYDYDWSLNNRARVLSKAQFQGSLAPSSDGNSGANNSIRYVVSSTIPKGTIENKIFNNLYSQVTRDDNGELSTRSTFFTTFITSLYGVSDRFNAGVEIRYRGVLNEEYPASALNVFGGGSESASRQGIATIGPKIRWAPVPQWGNFSIQSALWFPVMSELEGDGTRPFLDWNNATWWTQVFNDFTLGSSFSLFTEIDFLWEDIGSADDAFNRVSTPVTAILSYFPNPQTTLYALNGFSPFWRPEWDYFYQAGVGAKYQFTRKFELELLYTYFTNRFLQDNDGRASTVNLGVRFNL